MAMELERIQYVNFEAPDRLLVQESAIDSASKEPERHIEAYRADPRSLMGSYVAADLFKETFPAFRESRESRNRYNQPVHNASAVLSSALFSENLSVPPIGGRDAVYFITGSPGAGKTSMVLKEGRLPSDAAMVFEGQMSNFDTSRDKIQKTLDAGYRPHIIVVHPRVEDALQNTLTRFYQEGRGSSITAIARIVGNLPETLERLNGYFGNNLLLDVIDVRDRNNPVNLRGFENVSVLKSEGRYEEIHARLNAVINEQRHSGRMDDTAYRQAAGLAPNAGHAVDQQRNDGHTSDASRRRSAPGNREEALLSNPLSGASAATHVEQSKLLVKEANALDPRTIVRGEVVSVTPEHVIVQTGRGVGVSFDRTALPASLQVGRRIQLEYQADQTYVAEHVSSKEQNNSDRKQIEQTRGLNSD